MSEQSHTPRVAFGNSKPGTTSAAGKAPGSNHTAGNRMAKYTPICRANRPETKNRKQLCGKGPVQPCKETTQRHVFNSQGGA